MATTQAEVVEYIKNLRLSEVKALIETLEAELGVKASGQQKAEAIQKTRGRRKKRN